MQKFSAYITEKDIDRLLEKHEELYDIALSLAEQNITSGQQLYNELLGGLQAIGSAAMNSLGNLGRGIKSFGQNISNNYQQGERKGQIQQASRKVTDLQGDLKRLGFTDQKVQNFLTNVNNVLQTGLGKSMSFNGQTYNPGQNADFNTSAQNMRNMVRQGRMVQGGNGSGI
jgi:hypothetical protein